MLVTGPVNRLTVSADVKCAVRWLRAHAAEYHVDPARIGAYGNSAGAHLVSILGLCPRSAGMEGDGPYQAYSSRVQAVVASATPASFMIPMSERARARQSASTMSETLRKKISPITYVNADAPPFLLFHEVSDGTVGVYQSDKLVEALKGGHADVVERTDEFEEQAVKAIDAVTARIEELTTRLAV